MNYLNNYNFAISNDHNLSDASTYARNLEGVLILVSHQQSNLTLGSTSSIVGGLTFTATVIECYVGQEMTYHDTGVEQAVINSGSVCASSSLPGGTFKIVYSPDLLANDKDAGSYLASTLRQDGHYVRIFL
jgi:hypothetical protein